MPTDLMDPQVDDQQPAALPALQQPSVYDPNNPTPYQPIPTAQVIPQSQQLSPEEQIPNLGAAGHAGAIAYIGDKLLRGVMQGSAQAQVINAVKLQRQQSAAAALYDTTAQRLIAMKQAGADKSTPDEWQSAVAQKDAAYKALTDMWDQHVQKMTTDPKTGKQVPAKGNVLQRMFNHQDPMQIAPAWVEAMKANGAPVDHVLAQMDTPAYQARVAARAQQQGSVTQTGITSAATGSIDAQTAQQRAINDQRLNQLMTKSATEQLTPEEESEKTSLLNTRYMVPTDPKLMAKASSFVPVPGAKFYKNEQGVWAMPVRNSLTGMVSERAMPANFEPPLTAQTVPKPAWIDVGGKPVWGRVDQSTNQVIPGSLNPAVIPPTNIVGTLHSGNYMYTDAKGQVHQVPVSTSTRPAKSASGEYVVQGLVDQAQPAAAGQPPQAQATSAAASPAGNELEPSAQQQSPDSQQQPTAAAATSPQAAAVAPAPVPQSSSAAPHADLHQASQASTLQSVRAAINAGQRLNQQFTGGGSGGGKIIGNKGLANDDPTIAYTAGQVHDGLMGIGSVLATMKGQVLGYMASNNLNIGTKDTATEKGAEDSMRDLKPLMEETVKMLEPMKDKGGWFDSAGQRIDWYQYTHGKDAGPLIDALNQYTAFIQLAGASPWSKIGRNKLVLQTAMQHLPNPAIDSPGLMYRKLTDVQHIFNSQLGAAAARRDQGPITTQNVSQAQSGNGAAGPPPPPSSGAFSVQAGGKTHYFDTQQQLDTFKQLAHIK